METHKDKAEGVNLAIRLSEKQYSRLKKAAKRADTPVSTWMRETCLTCAGDTRQLEELLKSVCAHIEH
jgi:predicted DNA-binding protein